MTSLTKSWFPRFLCAMLPIRRIKFDFRPYTGLWESTSLLLISDSFVTSENALSPWAPIICIECSRSDKRTTKRKIKRHLVTLSNKNYIRDDTTDHSIDLLTTHFRRSPSSMRLGYLLWKALASHSTANNCVTNTGSYNTIKTQQFDVSYRTWPSMSAAGVLSSGVVTSSHRAVLRLSTQAQDAGGFALKQLTSWRHVALVNDNIVSVGFHRLDPLLQQLQHCWPATHTTATYFNTTLT